MPISGEQRYKLSKRRTQARSFPGVFWDSFTNHNTGNYLRHGINITTNQRLSPTLRGNANTIKDGDWQTSLSPPFSEGRGLYTGRSRRLLTQAIHKRLSSLFFLFLGEGASVHRLTLLYAQETTIARMRSHFCFPDRLLILNEDYLELDFQTARKKGFCRNSRNFLTAGH